MRTICILLLAGFFSQVSAQSPVSTNTKATLTIRVTNLKKDKGFLLLALYNHDSKFLKIFDQTKRKKVTEKEHILVFENLPYGTYAVSVFQDINSNDALDSNFLGIPKEPYGFSNNPSTLFGPPNFQKASFSVKTLHKKVTISL